ncbi:hypothetical protein Acy02nite_10240 [Actinoplanes cyaneus]|uniref:Uncharacterized protein n=1 Tax=Actinoplanes cyaneus TaxID=52696 RepID=A0A919M3F4_9ACTN|nr:hypothetical protein [Actinoplanes cyaneus]MCW2137093.1 hypothetical protein [Actinoplanes cyaneus]GID63143.1 hypothetical protein Acy02nite_10240 [Actinoplanes cyaneus]
MSGNDPYVNPYSGETNLHPDVTAKNTGDVKWLDGGPPLKVDLEGLRAYAKHMVDQENDISTRSMHLSHLQSMPGKAWSGDTLGEAAAAQARVTGNAAEFFAYLGTLGQMLHNVGMAAQTVADSYEANDAMSAASLNSVLFAFGEDVPRPAGLPKGIGQTYFEQLAKEKEKPLQDPGSALWEDGETKQVGPYQTVQTSTGPHGERREVITTTVNGGGKTVTTVVYDKNNKITSQSSVHTTVTFDDRTHTQVTTTQSYDAKGKPTGSTKETTAYQTICSPDGGTVNRDVSHQLVETRDAKGNVTNTRTTSVDQDGVTTEKAEKVTTTKDAKSGETRITTTETDKVVVGKQTQGQLGVTTDIASEYDPLTKEMTG